MHDILFPAALTLTSSNAPIPAQGCFKELPGEILLALLQKLSPRTLGHFCISCKTHKLLVEQQATLPFPSLAKIFFQSVREDVPGIPGISMNDTSILCAGTIEMDDPNPSIDVNAFPLAKTEADFYILKNIEVTSKILGPVLNFLRSWDASALTVPEYRVVSYELTYINARLPPRIKMTLEAAMLDINESARKN